MLLKLQLNTKHSQATPVFKTSQKLSPKMSSAMEDHILRHFSSLRNEEVKFTSGQSETQSHIPGQPAEDEAQEYEEALRILAQERPKGKRRENSPKWYHKR